MNHKACILQDLAQLMSKDPHLKAVWLDITHEKVSYAFQPGTKDQTAKLKIKELLNQHQGANIPECEGRQTQGEWNVICQMCKYGNQQKLTPGIRMINMPDAGIMLEKESCPTASRFWHWAEITSVKLRPRQMVRATEHGHTHTRDHHHHAWKPQLLSAAICGIFGIAAFSIGRNGDNNQQTISIGLFIAAFISGAWFPAQEVWELLRKRIIDIHFLMIAVGVGAAAIGHWAEGAVLLFLFSLSGAMEALAMARTEREIQGLFKEAPKESTQVDEQGNESAIDVDAISKGMLLRIRPGEQFPVDAKVTSGLSSADESTLTGESIPVDKAAGDTVFSGTMNTWGMIDCLASRPANESSLAKIITLIREAQDSKAPSQRFTDRFGTGYTYAVLAASTLMFLVWWLGFGVSAFQPTEGEPSAFYRAMTLLVVASPCALVLSIPSAILAGIAAGARGGVLFRGGLAIEKLADITHVAMDKTGTLTSGELEVIEVQSFPAGKESEILHTAAALAHQSTHPLSRSIVRHWRTQHPDEKLRTSAQFRSLTGMGITGNINGNETQLGRRDLFAKVWPDLPALPDIGVTETLIGGGGDDAPLRGRILLRDHIRPESASLLKKLYALNLQVTMLTGDREQSAQQVADEIHLSGFKAELQPEDKVNAIRSMCAQGEKVAMIGDGVNDAPSLAAADVAVGMGIRGSDAVLEQADLILMHDRLDSFHYAYSLSLKAQRIIRQNLCISLGVITLLVLGALCSALPLTLGVIGHEGSTVIVVLNSLRLLFYKKES